MIKILVLNSGSSSLKSQYFIDNKQIASVTIEQIGEKSSITNISYGSKKKVDNHIVANQHDALKKLFFILEDFKILNNIKELTAIGHRVVHGGTKFNSPTLINDEVIEEISSLIPLAPLHNPANLEAIKLIKKEYPKLNQVAVFDTAFHQTLKDYAYSYALPHKLCKKHNIRRYGFHGTSHSYVAKESAKILGKKL
jgi:acetate kinase